MQSFLKTERNKFIYEACQKFVLREVQKQVREKFGDDISYTRIQEVRDEEKKRMEKRAAQNV